MPRRPRATPERRAPPAETDRPLAVGLGVMAYYGWRNDMDGGAAIYAEMAGLGLEQTVIGVRFVPSEAVVIQQKPQLDRAFKDAGIRDVKLVEPDYK